MDTTRAIKRRIKSIGSTQQITRAMNLVAASKLTRAKNKLESARPFYRETRRVIEHLAALSGKVSNPYLTGRPVKTTGVIVIAGDRGLCGGYNINVCKLAAGLIAEKGAHESLIAVGTKSRDYFRRRRKNIIRTYQGISESPFYEDAAEIGHLAADCYNSGEMDEVYLVYSEFKSAMAQEPKAVKILPVELGQDAGADGENQSGTAGMTDFEPDEDTLLSLIIPKYINTVIYGAMVEASACEQGARMTGMDAATKNSLKLINGLTLTYNRARQGAITQEINEIVGGANAT
ncbi:MAG: ATP synthase F1 subunit gamma [Defluviitaleaceae bacterium]|nr:ATP synthase F1 subunit gamma [Defluviitaleaceae bacterium]